MTTCPYCKAKMPDDPVPYRALTKKQRSVFEAVLAGGPNGIAIDRLMKDFFKGLSQGTLRSCVYNINQVIQPLTIRGRGGNYYLQ